MFDMKLKGKSTSVNVNVSWDLSKTFRSGLFELTNRHGNLHSLAIVEKLEKNELNCSKDV